MKDKSHISKEKIKKHKQKANTKEKKFLNTNKIFTKNAKVISFKHLINKLFPRTT